MLAVALGSWCRVWRWARLCRSSGDSVECALLGVAGHSDDVERLLAGQMHLQALCRWYELRFRDGLEGQECAVRSDHATIADVVLHLVGESLALFWRA